MPKEWYEDEYYADDAFHHTDGPEYQIRHDRGDVVIRLHVDPDYHQHRYTEEEKALLRPMAETLGMLRIAKDRMVASGRDWYEHFLPEAAALWDQANADSLYLSWKQDLEHESTAVKEAYNSWKALKSLSR